MSGDADGGGTKLRLFVAVEVPEEAREAVDAACQPLRQAAPDLRWTDPAGWHLTCAFLGWVGPGRVPAIEVALAEAAAASWSFELALDGVAGTFGRRVLWAGLVPSAELEALANRVQAALVPLGFEPEERAFHAHLTLARTTRRGPGSRLPRGLEERYDGPSDTWTVEELVLMRSHLGRGGARYEAVGRWPLGAGAVKG